MCTGVMVPCFTYQYMQRAGAARDGRFSPVCTAPPVPKAKSRAETSQPSGSDSARPR